jgi:hypothetical protein
MIGWNSKSSPVVAGTQRLMTQPCGMYTLANRARGAPAALAERIPAGIMDSRNGSAMAAPAPRRTVRRDRCFFVT